LHCVQSGDQSSAQCRFTLEVIILALKLKERFDAGLLKDGTVLVASELSSTIEEVLAALESDNPCSDGQFILDDVKPLGLEDFNRGLQAHKCSTLGTLGTNVLDLLSGAMGA
jgi:hypothetical protein